MHSDISSNDDDLFSPSKSSSKKEHTNSLADDVERILKETSDGKIDSTLVRARLAHALYDTASNFVFNVDSHQRTLFNALNTLTNNTYAYNFYADVLEESIAKRMVVYDFLGSVKSSASNTKILSFLANKMDINVDSFFFNTYVHSMYEMLDFIINYNISLYLKICEYLNRTPVHSIVNRDVDSLDPKIMNSDDYIINSFSSIRKSFGYEF